MYQTMHLSRQEAVALVNTLERLSSSLVFAREFRSRRDAREFFPGGVLRDDGGSCGTGP